MNEYQIRTDAWAALVSQTDAPAAILDAEATILAASSSVGQQPGEKLMQRPEVANGGPDWDLRPLDPTVGIWLAVIPGADAPTPGPAQAATGAAASGPADPARIFDLAADCIVVFTVEGEILRGNPAACRAVGMTEESFTAQRLSALIHPEDLDGIEDAVDKAQHGGSAIWSGRLLRLNGGWLRMRASIVEDPASNALILIGRDASEQFEATEALLQRSDFDDLTGLASRSQVLKKLDDAIKKGTPAVLFADIDRFKVVNDSLGHDAGDELLQLLARRFEALDLGPQVTLGRVGGDEFVIVIPLSGEDEATRVADQMRSQTNDPFVLNGHMIFVDLSVGIAICPEPGSMSASELLGSADTAVYKAKDQGRDRVVVFDEKLRKSASRRLEDEAQLRSALDDHRVVPFFQPIVRLGTNEIVGVEALIRVMTREGGSLPPSKFLPVAEEVGLLQTLDDRVLNRSMHEFRGMRAPFNIGFNAAAQQLVDPNFADRVFEAADRNNFDLRLLMLELTESSVMTDLSTTTRNLDRLRERGAVVALDDFGTGYSSLSHLRTLPIDIVKLDRTFTAGLLEDERKLALARGVVALCLTLGQSVVAEGIESADQAELLAEMGCAAAQGFYFHHPMPVEELASIVELHSASVVAP